MSSINDILKKINKGREGIDRIDFVAEMPEDFLINDFLSTGSPYIDYLCGGGHVCGGMTIITGWESAGKSSLLLTSVKEAQKKFPNKTPVIFDSERSVTSNYLKRMGVDESNLIVRRSEELETNLDIIEEFSRSDDVSFIGIDSIKSFYSIVDEEKTAEDYTIGTTAKRWNTRMPIIKSNTSRRNIPLVFVHQWREDPGKMMGDNRVLSGGKWIKYMPDLHIDLSKRELIKENKVTIGHKLAVRIKKCKNKTYDKTEPYDVNFYYEGGFRLVDEYTSIFIEKGLISRGGAWFSFPDINGEEVKLQGKHNVVSYLTESKTDFDNLLKLV